MESKTTYRDAPSGEIKLPKAVYYRCLWTVRDAERLETLASVLESGQDAYSGGESVSSCTEKTDSVLVSDGAARHAAFELECIARALAQIPEVYRNSLLDNIHRKTPFPDFAHPNTWKRWKLVFLYELAKELCLI